MLALEGAVDTGTHAKGLNSTERGEEIKEDEMCDRIMLTICCLVFWCNL